MTQPEHTTARRSAVDVVPTTPAGPVDLPTSQGAHATLTGELSAVSASLHDSFDTRVGSRVVDAEIQQVADQFVGARIRSYVPLFVRRYAGAGLRRLSAQVPRPAARD